MANIIAVYLHKNVAKVQKKIGLYFDCEKYLSSTESDT